MKSMLPFSSKKKIDLTSKQILLTHMQNRQQHNSVKRASQASEDPSWQLWRHSGSASITTFSSTDGVLWLYSTQIHGSLYHWKCARKQYLHSNPRASKCNLCDVILNFEVFSLFHHEEIIVINYFKMFDILVMMWLYYGIDCIWFV